VHELAQVNVIIVTEIPVMDIYYLYTICRYRYM